MKRTGLLAALLFVFLAPAAAQTVAERIYDEGMNRSRVMHYAHYLTDVFGARLTGSPSLQRAGQWTLSTMTELGLQNAEAVAWDWGRPGWENERMTAHMTAPTRANLVGVPLAWTPSTPGLVSGEVMHVMLPSNATRAQFAAFADSVRGLVRGKMVLVGTTGTQLPAGFVPPPMRLTEEAARERFSSAPPTTTPSQAPPTPPAAAAAFGTRNPDALPAFTVSAMFDSLLIADGALLRVNAAGMPNGLIRAFANRSFDLEKAPPTLVLRDEDFGRMVRLLQSGFVPSMEVDIQNTVYPNNTTEYNYVAEIVGTDLAHETILIGGHIDSWHPATGATDNAAGVAVMMEVARILKAVGFEPRRTIRVALWTGEEQGLLGSRAYVDQVFGSFEAPKQPAYDNFAGYFNVDSGTGMLRGGLVFGPDETQAMLAEVLAPMDSLGVVGARSTYSRAIGGSDHTAFNNAGLPGISMGQDPIQYFTTTWHTNVDTFERLLEGDLKQAAIVVAKAVADLAMRDAKLPRFSAEDMPPAPGARPLTPSSR